MQLLAGQAAEASLRRLLGDPGILPAVAIDPEARRGHSITLLAVATPGQAAVLEPRSVPALASILAAGSPLCAWQAKEAHRALLRTTGTGPERWACIKLSEQLILGGRHGDLSLAAIAARYGLEPPPAVEGGFEALAAHAQQLARLVAAQARQLRQDDLVRVSRLEAAAVGPLATMEHRGMPFDAERWKGLGERTAAERSRLREQLLGHLADVGGSDLFGRGTVNLDSDAELKRALRALGHAVPDARRATLALLPEPLGPLLRRYRELSKRASAYGESFLEHVGGDGRIHATFEQIGASTGRIACRAPNLQAIVKDSPYRACFRASPQRRLVVADYATCELRILAEMSGDPVFVEAFARGEDLHARVASSIFGKKVSKTENPELRQRAKAVNFGLVYGMGARGLAHAIQASTDQAHSLLQRYFQTFPKIGTFLEGAAQEALTRGFARTLAGRRLYLAPATDRRGRAQAERVARNMPIQGTSADITKIALTRIHQRLADLPDSALVNCIHDEVVVECPAADSAQVAEVVGQEMAAAGRQLLRRVELAVDTSVVETWAG